MYTLYHGWRSSASRRVRLCLAEKGLAFEGKIIDLTKMEHHSPAFLKLNPNGVIPLLILEDGRSLYESGTICEYLDETHPDPPLRPNNAFDRAVMRNWIRHIDGLIGNLIVFNWAHGMAQIASKWSDAELAANLARVPSKERREAWLRTARRPYTEEERGEARDKLKVGLLDRMEEALSKSAWLVGDHYSLADIAAVPFVKRIDEEIAPDEMTAARHPRVAVWWSAIQARPAFAAAKIGPFTAGN
ncbi:MAG: glutathione S-transferase family protein [Reyranella sp.]|nr:glutathione S-transferase family protein [Reyranella sp.]MBL6651092.1 glutathione S-transferase family protein [Reyranella sp.]